MISTIIVRDRSMISFDCNIPLYWCLIRQTLESACLASHIYTAMIPLFRPPFLFFIFPEYIFLCIKLNGLLGVLSTSLSCLTSLSLDVKVYKEQYWKESSKKYSKVSSELNLKSYSVGWECLDNGVHCESWGSNSCSWDSSYSKLAYLRDSYKQKEFVSSHFH